MYTEKVMDHFKNPRNMGELRGADAEATVGNPTCGDVIKVMIKVKNNVIEDIRFQTMGCAAAIATSSMLTELVKGKSLNEAASPSSSATANSSFPHHWAEPAAPALSRNPVSPLRRR